MAPVRVTVLSVPTFFVPKVAVPPVSETASPATSPFSVRVSTVAEVLPSYTLSAAVKLPVIGFAVMSAVAVADRGQL